MFLAMCVEKPRDKCFRSQKCFEKSNVTTTQATPPSFFTHTHRRSSVRHGFDYVLQKLQISFHIFGARFFVRDMPWRTFTLALMTTGLQQLRQILNPNDYGTTTTTTVVVVVVP